ncbi:amino acid/polyamine transporter I [Massariosphaeria phaeospora]|uniref:Amino acid/polyamine transporter I n=1 Tax=Massariosphaeria phaeospora TaxID=100035 RepID=A0A7C8IM16_9PLEO|nr:amino acid/polyamine transporter I [Massariosphaeria phaeospora]
MKNVEEFQLSGNGDTTGYDPNVSSYKSNDEQVLAHFGKRQQLKRNFSLISVLGLGSTLMLTWEGSIVGIQPLLINGGPTGAIAAFPVVMTGVSIQVLVMAEMASMIPLAGGEYNWVAILSPPQLSNFLSYTTGWILTIAWQAACASVTWLNSSIILAIVSANYPTYQMKLWHGTMIFYAIVAVSILVNTYLGRIFSSLEAVAFVLHIVGFFVILIVIIYLAPKTDTSVVFGTFINGGNFSHDVLSAIIGAVSMMYSFNAEEIKDATVTIPRAMIITVLLNGITGWAMLIAMVYCMGPVEDVLTYSFGFPYIPIFQSITNSKGGATTVTCIILMISIPGSIGFFATASRMLWAFAREDGVPFSRQISTVEPRTALPIYPIAVTVTISLLLALINLGSTTAFNALSGLTVAGFYSAFIVSASVMLYRRLTVAPSDIAWGPFRLGKAGVPLTIIALVYSFVGWFFSFWPPVSVVTVKSFNWSLVVYCGTMITAMGWWTFRARFTYIGPRLEAGICDGGDRSV